MDIWRKWRNPRQKPPFGARIDWSDPITVNLLYCWLVEKRLPYVVVDFGIEHANFFVDPANWETVDGIVGHAVSTTDAPRPVTAISLCLLPKLNSNTSVHFVDYGNVVTLKANNWRSPELLVNQSSIGVAYYAFNFEVGGFLCSTFDGSVWRVYRDGKKSAEIIKSASIGRPSGSIRFFSYGSISAARLYSFVYIFGRIICDDEVERLYYEPYSFFLVPAARIFDLAPSSGTTFQKTVEGALSSSGEASLQFSAGQLFGGSIGPLGALGWEVSRYIEGELGPYGELQKGGQYEFSGALGPSGELSADLSAGSTLSGGVSASGSLSLRVSRERAFGGSIETSGTLLLNVHKTYLGQVNPSGVALNDQQEVELTADKLVGSRQKETLP